MFLAFRKPKLQDRTVHLIQSVFAVPWFGQLGESTSENAYVAGDWAEAIRYCEDPDKLFLELSGNYTAALQSASPRRDRAWNELASQVKALMEPAVDQQLSRIASLPNEWKVLLRNRIRWVLLHAFLEEEYSDVLPTGFFRSLIHWFPEGHVPCGWQGRYPEGKLVIY